MAAPGTGHAPAVEVWWASTGRHDWQRFTALLDAGERQRLDAFRQAADRERFVLAATLVRCATAAVLGVPVPEVRIDRTCDRCGKPHGRPRLAAPAADLGLSITHSGTVAGVAACRAAAVGLDVELAGRLDDVDRLRARVLAERERRAFDRAVARGDGALTRETAFLRLWARKEALTKMLGTGITVPLAQVVVSGPDEPARCLALPAPEPPPGAVALHDLPEPARDHVPAVAAARPGARPRVHDGDALLADLRV